MSDIQRPDGNNPVITAAQSVVRAAEAVDSNISHDGKRTDGIVIPKTMSLQSAVRKIEQYAEAEAATTKIVHDIDTMHAKPAALAFKQVLKDSYGVDFATPQPGFFAPKYPVDITVPVSPTDTELVTLGEFKLGNLDVETVVFDGRPFPRLRLIITCANKHKPEAELLIEQAKHLPDSWRGKCIIFEGDLMHPTIAEPSLTIDDIALNKPEAAALSMFLNQCEHHAALLDTHNIPFKRGVLMYGPWGTGKTLAAAVAMQACINSGITVIQQRNWALLEETMHLARYMQPCMVFCEDIDRIESRALTNLLDDASLKDCAVSLVVTTNNPEKLDPALTRTGRLDICIGFDLPGPDARAQILAINNAAVWNDDIESATDGFTGSDLAEVAKRATVNAFAAGRTIVADDVLAAAVGMQRPPAYVAPDTLEASLKHVLNTALSNTNIVIDEAKCLIDDIHNSVC